MTAHVGRDPVAERVGLVVEDLSALHHARQPLASGPTMSRFVIEEFLGGAGRRWARATAPDGLGLVTAGLVTPDGAVTAVGTRLRVEQSRLARQWDLVASDAAGQRHASLRVGAGLALVIEEVEARRWQPDGEAATEGGDDVRAQVQPSSATPLVLARWVGLEPSWSVDHGLATISLEVLQRRLRDPGEPTPAHADDALSAMWAQPWVWWTLSCRQLDVWQEGIHAGARGQYEVRVVGPDTAVLRARPGTLLWGEIQAVSFPSQGAAGEGWF